MDLIKLTDYAAEKGRDPEEIWTALCAVIETGQAPKGLIVDRKKRGAVRYIDRDAIRLVDLKNEESLAGRVTRAEVDIVDLQERMQNVEARVA